MNPLKSTLGDCNRGIPVPVQVKPGAQAAAQHRTGDHTLPTRANEGYKSKAQHLVRGQRALCLTQFRGNRRPTAIKGGGRRRARPCGGDTLGLADLGVWPFSSPTGWALRPWSSEGEIILYKQLKAREFMDRPLSWHIDSSSSPVCLLIIMPMSLGECVPPWLSLLYSFPLPQV